jgi:protein O-GlcNAc transferase
VTAESWNDLGVQLKQQGRLDQAIAAYRQAIAERAEFDDAHYNLGNAYRALGRMEEAQACFQRAVEADPAHLNALAALGQTLEAGKQWEAALGYFERALALAPGDAGLWCHAGDALERLRRFPEAIAHYQAALGIEPQLARAWYSAGCAERARKEDFAAAACFRHALETVPEWLEARHNLGQALFELGQVDEAMAEFERADTGGRSDVSRAMMAVIVPGSPAADNRHILELRRAWAERVFPQQPYVRTVRTGEGKLRIGYISSFFHRPNWMKPVWALIHHHDREKFAVHLFSDVAEAEIGPEYHRHPADVFHDISALANAAAADRIEQCGLDLLVDLNGYSNLRRLPLFTLRPAPVIAGWFNMYATTGMPCYDYLVGDAVVIPPEEEQFYSEKILRVPGTYLPFEVGYPVPEVAPASAARGEFTFGCLASQYKITSDVIAAWSRILLRAPHASLLLRNGTLGSESNRRFVTAALERFGIETARVRLEGPAPHGEFLKTYGEIDLALDTFPYNGGTTTTEAIWQGVPVVTFHGDRWVSRTSASILRAGGLGQFVAADVDGYVALAAELANSAEKRESLAELRAGMRAQLLGSPACDAAGFARAMEELYREMARA